MGRAFIKGRGQRAATLTAAVLIAALSAGCATSSSGGSKATNSAPPAASTSATPSSSSSSSSESAFLSATSPADAVALGYKGTFETPPTSGPTAVAGKSVWVVSCGQAAYSCAIPAGYAMDAVKAIGWQGKLCDGKLDPSAESACIENAIAAKANAVLLGGIDCSGLVSALKDARSAGLKVVSPLGFDCNDPHVGGQPLFSADLMYAGGKNLEQYMYDWGASKAAWVVGHSNGTAKVINVTLDGVLVPTYANQAFEQMIKQCSGCKLDTTVHLTLQDLVSGAASQKVATALQTYRDATYLHAPFDSAIPAFIASAIKDSGRKDITVMGSECFPLNLDYIRHGGPESACSALGQDWQSWAAVDMLNRLFSGADPSSFPDSGVGVQLVDKTHNMPASGAYEPPVDFKAAFLKIWGK